MNIRNRLGCLSAGCFVFAGCAADPVNQGSFPTAPFRDYADDIAITSHCSTSTLFGCANILTSGSLVRGSFAFKNIFVQCTTTDAGSVISIKNAEDDNFTFNIQVNMPSPKAGTNTCEGEAEGGCFVSTLLHTTPLLSSTAEPCYITLESLAPMRGNILCEGLSATNGELNVESGSAFSCQN